MTSIQPIRREQPQPQSFRRDEIEPGNKFLRWIAATVIAQRSGRPLADVVAEHWPNDRVLETVIRATSALAMTSVAGWAKELARIRVEALQALAPMSAGAQLLQAGTVLSLDGYGSISVPGFATAASNAGFVQEGNPIPVKQLVSSAASLLPYKLASICALTQEMIDSSNAEALIGDALMRSAGATLDSVLFDANAATAARPAGLRNGIAAQTASNATDTFEAVYEDIAILINAVAAVGGAGPYIIIGAPGRVIGVQARSSFGTETVVKFLGSPAIGNDLIAVAAGAVVSAFSPTPDIETGNAATLVMDDTAPATPDTTQPTKSMFQTSSVAVKMRWPVSWALRDARGLAWLTPTWK